MKKRTLLAIAFVTGFISFALAQESDKPKDRPVRSPWETGILLESQNTLVPRAKTIDFVIQHRFGTLNSEDFDLFGIYAPSNIRLGVSYGVTDNINIGFGTNKFHMIQDLNWKYSILKQTRSGKIPVSMTYYGNVEYDARKDEVFGLEYNRGNRLSYFHQIMVSKKFSDKLTLQVSSAYTHFNQVNDIALPGTYHDNFNAGLLGRYKIGETTGVIFNYNQPFRVSEMVEPSVALGVEFGTSSHSFQLFVSNAQMISFQNNLNSNQLTLADGNLLIGFNITRLYFL